MENTNKNETGWTLMGEIGTNYTERVLKAEYVSRLK
jgi:hypothetical protein